MTLLNPAQQQQVIEMLARTGSDITPQYLTQLAAAQRAMREKQAAERQLEAQRLAAEKRLVPVQIPGTDITVRVDPYNPETIKHVTQMQPKPSVSVDANRLPGVVPSTDTVQIPITEYPKLLSVLKPEAVYEVDLAPYGPKIKATGKDILQYVGRRTQIEEDNVRKNAEQQERERQRLEKEREKAEQRQRAITSEIDAGIAKQREQLSRGDNPELPAKEKAALKTTTTTTIRLPASEAFSTRSGATISIIHPHNDVPTLGTVLQQICDVYDVDVDELDPSTITAFLIALLRLNEKLFNN